LTVDRINRIVGISYSISCQKYLGLFSDYNVFYNELALACNYTTILPSNSSPDVSFIEVTEQQSRFLMLSGEAFSSFPKHSYSSR